MTVPSSQTSQHTRSSTASTDEEPPSLGMSRSGSSSIMEATCSKLHKLKLRLEDEEATIHKQLRHFYDIKLAISRICQNDEEYMDNPDIIKANTVLEDRALPCNPKRKCYTARDALNMLKAGNAQFLRDEVLPKQSSQRHVALHFGQKPHAVIIACSDSRVPPEMIFNQGFGDLFVIRLAGNTVDALARASLLYAVLNLEAPLVVVLGHESCGAVTAALAPEEATAKAPGDIKALIKNIQKGLQCDTLAADTTQDEGEKLMCSIVANVFHVVHTLEAHPDIEPLVKSGKLAVVGAYYGFHGVVSFFDDAATEGNPALAPTPTTNPSSTGSLCGHGDYTITGQHTHEAAEAAPATVATAVLDGSTHLRA